MMYGIAREISQFQLYRMHGGLSSEKAAGHRLIAFLKELMRRGFQRFVKYEKNVDIAGIF